MTGELERAQALVLDSRRFGSVAERAAYLRAVESRYRDVETVMNQLMALPTWDDRSPGWVDDQLVLTTAVVHQIGTLRGEYDDARSWGDSALALGSNGSRLRRADLMLHLSEIHRVTGRAERSAELVHEAADLLRLPRAVAGGRRRAGAGHLPRLLLPGRAGLLGGPAATRPGRC